MAQGWFSPIKGSYPSLAQIDKTLPAVKPTGTNQAIKRGSIVQMTADGFALPNKGTGAAVSASLLYISLQEYTDAQAAMAGTVPYDGNVSASLIGADAPGMVATAGMPTITGLSVTQEGEYETDQYDSSKTYTLGCALYADTNGLITTDSTNTEQIGICTAVPASRWINNADAKTVNGMVVRQGASKSVIRFRTK